MIGLTPVPLVCAHFYFCSDESVGIVDDSYGSVSGVGSVVSVLKGIKSIDDLVMLVMFVPKLFESKCRQHIEIF